MELTRETPKEQWPEIAQQMAEEYLALFSAGRTDKACSMFINSGVVSRVVEIAEIIEVGYESLVNDKKALCKICNSTFFVEIMIKALESMLGNPSAAIGLDGKFLQKTMPLWIDRLCKDFALFLFWCLWEGGDTASCRKHLKKETVKTIVAINKRDGVTGFLSYLWRALVAYDVMIKKAFEPRLKELLRGADDTKINSLADAFKGIV